jgi:hypothetical protein
VIVRVPSARLRALVNGEAVTLLDAEGLVRGSTVVLVDGGRDHRSLAAAYRRWDTWPVSGRWTATVTRLVTPGPGFGSRHVLEYDPGGPVAIVRVAGDDGPVLSDRAFAARDRSVG